MIQKPESTFYRYLVKKAVENGCTKDYEIASFLGLKRQNLYQLRLHPERKLQRQTLIRFAEAIGISYELLSSVYINSQRRDGYIK